MLLFCSTTSSIPIGEHTFLAPIQIPKEFEGAYDSIPRLGKTVVSLVLVYSASTQDGVPPNRDLTDRRTEEVTRSQKSGRIS